MVGEEEGQMHNSNQRKGSACPCGLSSFVTTTLTLLALAIGQAGSAMAEGMRVRVMTQNMYVGSAFSALLASVSTVEDLKAAVTKIYNNILASKPNERAIAVAKEIKTEHPDIIALQEAWILRTKAAVHLPVAHQRRLLRCLEAEASLGSGIHLLPRRQSAESELGTEYQNGSRADPRRRLG